MHYSLPPTHQKEVLFISQDDKARFPIGLTAAHKKVTLLMHLEYRLSLPDHDLVVAAGHKLIPSVYADKNAGYTCITIIIIVIIILIYFA